ncbi:MAG: hypothetical protein ACOCT9_01015 [archaeon]
MNQTKDDMNEKNLSQINKSIKSANENDDLFICSASFEKRSLLAPLHLDEDYQAKKAIIYMNTDFIKKIEKKKIEENVEILKEILYQHTEDIKLIRGSRLKAHKQFNRILSIIKECKKELKNIENISMDITTFNREALLVSLAIINNNFKNFDTQFIYVSPDDHGEWLSRGFRKVRNILSFPGIHNSNKPILLIILSGFEPDRTIKVIEEYEPTKVLLGFGKPPTKEKFLERNKRDQKIVRARQIVEEFNFATNDIEKCKEDLNKLIDPYRNNYNVIIAPMSTKLSTIASYLVAEEDENIQLVYSLVGEYNYSNYSKGIEDIYLEKLRFSNNGLICKK